MRRLCPGQHLVESSAWILIVSMLATLNISKAVDEHGNVLEPEVKFENPIFRCVQALITLHVVMRLCLCGSCLKITESIQL